jgi:hypothetical protein
MMGFDVREFLVFMIFPIQPFALFIKREWGAVDPVQYETLPHQLLPLIISHRLAVIIVLIQEVLQYPAIV